MAFFVSNLCKHPLSAFLISIRCQHALSASSASTGSKRNERMVTIYLGKLRLKKEQSVQHQAPQAKKCEHN
jgi:hypothetical protein